MHTTTATVRRNAPLALLGALLLGPVLILPESGRWIGARGLAIQCAAVFLFALILAGASWRLASPTCWRRFLLSGPTACVLLLVGWATVSYGRVAATGGVAERLALVELLRLGCGAAVYFAAASTLNSRADLRRAVFLMLTAAILAAGAGLLSSHLNDSSVSSAAFGNSQLLAAFLVAFLPVTVVFASIGEVDRRRLLAVFGATLVVSALLLTENRSAWLGGAVGLLLAALLAVRVSSGEGQAFRRQAWLVPALGSLVAVGIFFAVVRSAPSVGSRLEGLSRASGDPSVNWRLGMASVCLNVVRASPVAGSGIGSFPLVAAESDRGRPLLFPAHGQRHFTITVNGQNVSSTIPSREQVAKEGVSMSSLAHNEYFQLAAELGLVGLALYLGMLLSFFGSSLRALSRLESRTRRWVIVAAMSGVAAQAIDALSNPGWRFAEVNPVLWLLIGVGVAAGRARDATVVRTRTRSEREAGWQVEDAAPRGHPRQRFRLTWRAAPALLALLVAVPALAHTAGARAEPGSGPARPQNCYLTIAPRVFDFGRVCIDADNRNPVVTRVLTLGNRPTLPGEDPFDVAGDVATSPSPPFFGGGGFEIAPGTQEMFNLDFRPAGPGQFRGNVAITSNDPLCPGTVTLLASGVAVRVLALLRPPANSTINFGRVRVGRTATAKIKITNPTPFCTLRGNVAVAPSPPFSGGGAFNIAGVGSRTFTISFSPPSRGVFVGAATITSNDPATPVATINLRGRGVNFLGF